MHMNYCQIMSPRPAVPRKVGVMTPQLLWERRPCLYSCQHLFNTLQIFRLN